MAFRWRCCWVARTGRGLYSSDEIDEDDRLDIEEVLYAIRNGWCGRVEVDQSKVEAVVDVIEGVFEDNDEADTAEDACIPNVKEEVIEVVEPRKTACWSATKKLFLMVWKNLPLRRGYQR